MTFIPAVIPIVGIPSRESNMQLDTVEHPAKTRLTGEAVGIIADAGQRLVIETSPDGCEILDVVIPAGKQWRINASLDIEVTDV